MYLWTYTQWRFRWVCAFGQFDQILHLAHFRQPRMQSYFMPTRKILITLRGCAGWFKSSLGGHVKRYVSSGSLRVSRIKWVKVLIRVWLIHANERPKLYKYFWIFIHQFIMIQCLSLFVLRFYGPNNPMGSCRARSVYLTTRLLGRHSPLSG